MKRRGLILIAVLAGLFALIRSFPLSWAASAAPEFGATYSGTIWNGQVRDIPLLGQLNVKGRLFGANIDSGAGPVTLRGDVSPGGVKDLILSMPIASLPMNDQRLAGLDGRFSLTIDEATIQDGACVSATGRASTNVLAANQARFDWAGPDLSGPIDCVDGDLRVQLSGEDATQRVEAIVVTGLDGVYRADISVRTNDLAAGNVLALFGFTPDGADGYALNEQGRWR